MDLIALGQKLKENPLPYMGEYRNELRTFETLLALPNPPIKQLKPLVSFIILHAHIEPEKTMLILSSALNQIKHPKIRSSILNGMILIRQKGIISSRMLINCVLMNSNSPKEFLSGCKEFIDLDCFEILKEWHDKGTEKQRIFCYYLLMFLYTMLDDSKRAPAKNSSHREEINDVKNSNNERLSDNRNSNNEVLSDNRRDLIEGVICSGFLGEGRVTRSCILYFLNKPGIDSDIQKFKTGIESGKQIYRELQGQVFDREMKVMKIQVFLKFKKFFKIRKNITEMILGMINAEKDDLKTLLDCLVESVGRGDAESVLRSLSEDFVVETKEDDVICYGMNVMREIYYKIAGIDKEGYEYEESDEYEDILDDPSNNEDDLSNNDKSLNEPPVVDEFAAKIKQQILKYIELFKGNKTRSISCAYRMLIKALIKGEAVNKDSTYVNKATTKEERTMKRKQSREERIRELKAEHYENRKNKRGRSRNKKNRLLVPIKKKKFTS